MGFNQREIGKERARLNRLEETGFYGLSDDQRQEGVRNSIIARGKIPWEDDEIQYCVFMINYPAFRYPEGSQWVGKINRGLIKKILNDTYHKGEEIRTEASISYVARYKT